MEFEIVTSADENFSLFLNQLAKNTFAIFKKKLWVYDLGLSPKTKRVIRANYLQIKNLNPEFKKINNKSCIKAIHKPSCIIDFCQKNLPFVFIDADCLFTKKNNFPSADIALTFRHYSEQTLSDFLKNGILNTGVIYINPTQNHNNLLKFLQHWEKLSLSSPEITDQMALSILISSFIEINNPFKTYTYNNLKITILKSEIYNDIKCRTGYIFHFKTAGRRKSKKNKYIKYAKHITRLYFPVLIYCNRIILFIKNIYNPHRYKFRYKKYLRLYKDQYKNYLNKKTIFKN